MDKAEAKAKQLQSWTAVAPGWGKYDETVTAWAAPVAARMIELAGIGPGARVLDVASGAGEPAITIAEKVGPGGSVLGTDFVEEMLAFARQKAAKRSVRNIEFRRVDGEALEVDGKPFDAVTIRWGLMFMPDPLACLRPVHRALRPGGRLAVACWADPPRNPFVTVPMGVLKRHMTIPDPPPGAPGIFAFSNADRLRGVLMEAGFHDVVVEQVTIPMADFATGAEYDVFIRALAGPVASLFSQLPADKQAVVKKEIAEEAERKSAKPGRVVLQGVTHVAAGTR
jgi:SAM-dependent methyltransferase